jgi:hypothetical protein
MIPPRDGLVCLVGRGRRDPEAFAESWHILVKGSIVAAGKGDVLAGRKARAMGESLLDAARFGPGCPRRCGHLDACAAAEAAAQPNE